MTKELSIENTTDQRASMVMVSLKPEPIPLDLKVILIGSANIYQTLLAIDSDFRKLFKIKVEFEDDAPLNNENANKLIRRWIPKGSDISQYTDAQIQQIANWCNDYPRRMYGGLSVRQHNDLIQAWQ